MPYCDRYDPIDSYVGARQTLPHHSFKNVTACATSGVPRSPLGAPCTYASKADCETLYRSTRINRESRVHGDVPWREFRRETQLNRVDRL